ncbi:hypothetical protein NC652_023291 [Populus alba x Populus x berolinensis]|nr:hypothetical protein NC652_023291 [Populus alba x Populus x berolinensis]
MANTNPSQLLPSEVHLLKNSTSIFVLSCKNIWHAIRRAKGNGQNRNDPDSSTPSQIGWKGNQLESPELREAWRGPPNLNMVQLQKVTKNPCPLKEFKFVSVSFLCLE